MNDYTFENITAENAEGTQYAATVNGKRWSGITTDRKIIPAHQKTVMVPEYDENGSKVGEVEQIVDVPEQTIWANRFGEALQEAIDGGAEVTPYVAPPEPDPNLIALQQTDKAMARVTEDLIDTLVAKGVITLDDLPVSAKEKIVNRKSLREKL